MSQTMSPAAAAAPAAPGWSTAAPSAPTTSAAGRPAPPRRATLSLGFYGRAWYKLRRDPVTLTAAGILGVIVVVTLLAPAIATQVLHTSPEQIMREPDGRMALLRPPGAGYPLGT